MPPFVQEKRKWKWMSLVWIQAPPGSIVHFDSKYTERYIVNLNALNISDP